MEEAIIGVLGAGILGLLGFFLQSIKSDIRALGERLDARLEVLETAEGDTKGILGEVKERLAAIEATQAEHGRLLGHMMGYGERIAALERAAGAG